MARVHRTYWIVRQRYRRAGYLGSLVAVVVCAFWLVPIVNGSEHVLAGSASFDPLGTGLMLLVAALAPVVMARLCWRLHRRRYFAEIYPLGVV